MNIHEFEDGSCGKVAAWQGMQIGCSFAYITRYNFGIPLCVSILIMPVILKCTYCTYFISRLTKISVKDKVYTREPEKPHGLHTTRAYHPAPMHHKYVLYIWMYSTYNLSTQGASDNGELV